MAQMNRPAQMLASTAAACLAAAAWLDLAGRDGHARQATPAGPKVVYTLDQESGASLFANGRATTEGFLASLKRTDSGVRRLVLSSRILETELARPRPGAAGKDQASTEEAKVLARKAQLGKIVEAAKAANILLTRLAIVPPRGGPSLASANDQQQGEAVKRHVELAQVARDLGCSTISVEVASTGDYEDQKKIVRNGLKRLRDGLKQKELDAMVVLLSTGPGLGSNGVWLRQLFEDAVGVDKLGNLGLLLDVEDLDYSPRTAFNELTARDPVTRKKAPPATADAPPNGNAAPPLANPATPTTPAADPGKDVKAIVFDAFDAVGGIEVPGLGDHLSRALLGSAGFEGEICVRYRGQKAGFKECLAKLGGEFGPEAPASVSGFATPTPVQPGDAGTQARPAGSPAAPVQRDGATRGPVQPVNAGGPTPRP